MFNNYVLTDVEKEMFYRIRKRFDVGRMKFGHGLEVNDITDPISFLDEAIDEVIDQLEYLLACRMLIDKWIGEQKI